jgi:hypothetical protein
LAVTISEKPAADPEAPPLWFPLVDPRLPEEDSGDICVRRTSRKARIELHSF